MECRQVCGWMLWASASADAITRQESVQAGAQAGELVLW